MNSCLNIRSATLLLTLLVLAACQPASPLTNPGREGGWIDWNGEGGWTGREVAEGLRGKLLSAGKAAVEEAPLALSAPSASEAEVEYEESTSSDRLADQSTALRAGSVDDNAQWDDYLLYRLRFADWGIPVHDVDVTERHVFKVTNEQGQPVLGAHLRIRDSQGRELAQLHTHSDGTALFFPLAYEGSPSHSYQVVATKGEAEAELNLERDQREHTLTLRAPSTSRPVRLDLQFLIDATGSMSDEIQQLKMNMIAVAEQIHDLPTQPQVRFGMTIYRDRGDLFVSRSYDFTPDVQAFTEALSEVLAEGGGDYAESLNEGLHNAIHLPEWRVEDTVSLIFLIADAPPHLDYAQDYDYAEEVFEAAGRGIKVYPLASSGLDDQGEYIFRQLAQISGGKFLFLTYGADGAPGDETPHHVEDYSVLSLDELVVRLVEEELAPLSP